MQRSMMLLVVSMLATMAVIPVRVGHAADESLTVVVRFYPTPGREDELRTRLTRLRDFVHRNNPGVLYKLYRSAKPPVVFILYEIFPSQASFDNQSKYIFPAFQKENGPVPEGIVTRPVEQEMLREVDN